MDAEEQQPWMRYFGAFQEDAGLSSLSWSEKRDLAEDRLRDFVRTWMTWGETRLIPLSLRNECLKCYKCGKQASWVDKRYVLRCEKCVKAFNRERAKHFGWRGRVQRWRKLMEAEQREIAERYKEL